MKKLLSLALLITFFSCDKVEPEPETGIPATNTNPNTPGGNEEMPWWYIPNWKHGDTLEGTIQENGHVVGLDTIYTFVDGDASMIVYQGRRYYIWKKATHKEERLLPDQYSYTNCIVSPTMKEVDAINKMASVLPHVYKDQQGNMQYQRQGIVLDGTTFTIKAKSYLGLNIKK